MIEEISKSHLKFGNEVVILQFFFIFSFIFKLNYNFYLFYYIIFLILKYNLLILNCIVFIILYNNTI